MYHSREIHMMQTTTRASKRKSVAPPRPTSGEAMTSTRLRSAVVNAIVMAGAELSLEMYSPLVSSVKLDLY